jgi:hypothetical protein
VHQAKYLSATTQKTHLLLVWLSYLRTTVSRRTADTLLDTSQGALIEIAGCLSLGLVRPAIFSIRAQFELLLAWIYFNDHPIEWSNFEKTGRDYPLRGVLISYFRNNDDRFSERFRLLLRKRERQTEDPYNILSLHVHSISPSLGPTVGPLSSLVQPESVCDEALTLLAEVIEYLTDTLASWYADRWYDFPREITEAIETRLTAVELAEFCR